MAIINYTGANPTAAKAWVQTNVSKVDKGKTLSTTIGGVMFELFGPPGARTLIMSVYDDDMQPVK